MRYKCGQCGIEKDANQFYSSPEGRKRPSCLSCLAKLKEIRGRKVEEHRSLRRSLKDLPCTDCHKRYPSFVMDFDHVGTKTRNLAHTSSFSSTRIKSEASQCEVVCANCHRLRTNLRGQNKSVPKPVLSTKRPRDPDDWRPQGPLCGRTKVCNGCQKDLPIEWFASRNDRGRAPNARFLCHPCMSKNKALWYKTHPEHRLRTRMAEIEHKKKCREYTTRYKERRGCIDCGKKLPACALDFDHVGTDKISGVSAMVTNNYSLEKIILEIAKCEVVCANCHRYRTHGRRTQSR